MGWSPTRNLTFVRSNLNTHSPPPAAKPRPRRWLLIACLIGWTGLAAAAVAWLISDAANLGNAVIRVGAEEPKAWSARVRETVTLARLNFPWALAWLFLAPYALWVGARFSFDSARWVSRLAVLLVAGAAFVGGSQWLSKRLVAGQRMVVMLKYTNDTFSGKVTSPDGPLGEATVRARSTNVVITNRFTQVMVSDEARRTGSQAEFEFAASGMLPELGTNLPGMFSQHFWQDLSSTRPARASRWSAVLDGFAFVALVGLAHAGVFHRRYREREQQAAVLESQLNQARLSALQAQLQPHFLFNTLNGIATLLRRDPATAGEMLQSVSDLLRIALSTSDRQEVSLREELAFLDRYLAIQQMRFGDRLKVVQEIQLATLECLVPALLLQPLVENAIRHGLEPAGRAGHLRLTAAREGVWLLLKVEDDGVGFSDDPEREGSGVGLANVRERLATLHGDAHEFRLEARPAGGVAVVVRLPARSELESAQPREAAK